MAAPADLFLIRARGIAADFPDSLLRTEWVVTHHIVSEMQIDDPDAAEGVRLWWLLWVGMQAAGPASKWHQGTWLQSIDVEQVSTGLSVSLEDLDVRVGESGSGGEMTPSGTSLLTWLKPDEIGVQSRLYLPCQRTDALDFHPPRWDVTKMDPLLTSLWTPHNIPLVNEIAEMVIWSPGNDQVYHGTGAFYSEWPRFQRRRGNSAPEKRRRVL